MHSCAGTPIFLNFKLQDAIHTLHTASYKLLAAVCLVVLFLPSCSDPRVSESPPALSSVEGHSRVESEQAQPARIVSLAPSITEILYGLGLDDRIAGVTRYCDYPPRALEKPRVGGYFDVNYEALLALEPDLVILLVEHEDAHKRLGDLGIETLAVDHSRVDGILRSIRTIADRCGEKGKGRELRRSLENRIQRIQEKFSSVSPDLRASASVNPPPRVLVAVGRSLQSGQAGEIYVSGRDGFYDDLISLAGGINAYQDETLKFPALSAEGLVRLDPDVIIEMIPDVSPGDDVAPLMSYWRNLPGLRAVRDGRVHILGGDHVVVPGPRFIDLLEEMGEIINQEKETISNYEFRISN